jgi:hypothetical protein
MRLKGRRSVQIVVGIVPILLAAAVVEAFASPSNLPGPVKAFLSLALALGLLTCVLTARPPISEELAP